MLRTLRRPIAHRTCTRLPTSRPAATRSVRVARHTTPIRLPNTLQTRSFFRSRTVRYEDEEDPSTWIFDVSDETFQEQVVDESHNFPIILHCWANWCKPCRSLTPSLESTILDYEGKLRLAKLNVDTNPETTAALGVTAIPAVFAYSRGEIVDRFVGGIPRDHVSLFAKRLLSLHESKEENPTPSSSEDSS